jgi:outer membrane protein assembly factor BamB
MNQRRLRRTVLALVVSMLGLGTAASASWNGPPSVALQIDTAHTGTTHFTPALRGPLERAWQVDLGARVSYPLIADGMVFVTYGNPPPNSYGANVIAFDAATGHVRWGPVPIAGEFFEANPAFADGRVYVVDMKGGVNAFDAADGQLAWRTSVPHVLFISPPTAEGGILYFGGTGDAENLYALDDASGDLAWFASVRGGETSAPAILDGSVFVSYDCTQVYSFDPVTGNQNWHYSGLCSGSSGFTAVARDGRLYVRDNIPPPSGYIFDTPTGSVLGRFDAQTIPAIGTALGFFLQAGTLRGIDLVTNQSLWSYGGDGGLASSPIVVDDTVLIGSTSGVLYALDARSGAVSWQEQVGASILASNEGQSLTSTGLAAGEGVVAVPASHLLTVYRPRDSIFANGFEAANP